MIDGAGALPAGQDDAALTAAVAAALAPVPNGAKAVVALSGGADSAALAVLSHAARPDLRLVAVHVRHGLREDSADAVAARAVARRVGIAVTVVHVTVAADDRHGPEGAAREARYAALADVAGRSGAGWILVGHTADDQAETVLLNLVRGSGVRGVAGMPAERAHDGLRLVRPLLRLRRADVRRAATGLPTVEDPTNADIAQPRARMRHDVLPLLATLGRDPVPAITRLADLARADADALDALAAEHALQLVSSWGPVRVVARAALDALPDALATRVVRLMLAGLRPGLVGPGLAGPGLVRPGVVGRGVAGLDAAAVGAVLNLRAGQAFDVPGGGFVTCGGGWLAAAPSDLAALSPRRLPVPGDVHLPEIDCVLRAGDAERCVTGARVPPGAHGSGRASVLAPRGALHVRARRAGDRLHLPGGRKRLHDLFVDAGIPRALRPLVPVVVDEDDEPLWVPGVGARTEREHEGARRVWLAVTGAHHG